MVPQTFKTNTICIVFFASCVLCVFHSHYCSRNLNSYHYCLQVWSRRLCPSLHDSASCGPLAIGGFAQPRARLFEFVTNSPSLVGDEFGSTSTKVIIGKCCARVPLESLLRAFFGAAFGLAVVGGDLSASGLWTGDDICRYRVNLRSSLSVVNCKEGKNEEFQNLVGHCRN